MAKNQLPNCPLDCKVYVGGLTRQANREEIERAFGHYGKLRNVFVARNPPGFAFVEYEDPQDAEDSVRALDGRYLCGVRVKVEISHGKTRNKVGGGGGGHHQHPPSSFKRHSVIQHPIDSQPQFSRRRRSRSIERFDNRRRNSYSRSSSRSRGERERNGRGGGGGGIIGGGSLNSESNHRGDSYQSSSRRRNANNTHLISNNRSRSRS